MSANHVDYPHEPGYLYDCPACEASCHCEDGSAECVYDGPHRAMPAVTERTAIMFVRALDT